MNTLIVGKKEHIRRGLNNKQLLNFIKIVNALFFFYLCFPTVSLAQKTKIDSLESKLLIYKKSDTTKVNLLNSLSDSYVSLDIIKAKEKSQEANSLAKKLNYKKGEARSFLRISNIHRRYSEMDEAEEYALKALKLFEEINHQNGINSSKVNLAQIASYNNDPDKALEYYKEVLNTSIINNDSLWQARMLNNIGIISHSQGNLDEALTFFKKSITIKEKIGKEVIGTLNNIAVICLNQGRYTEALEYFNRCLSIYRDDNDKLGIAQSTYNMSAVYYELQQYKKTLIYLEESLQLYKELNIKSQIASCLVNIGAVYSDLKEFPKALAFITESLNISKEINDIEELSAGYFQLGDLRLLMGQPKMAIKNYKTCLELSLPRNNKIYICHAHIGLGNAYVAMKNYSKALYHALEGEVIAEDLELLAQKKLASGILATAYSKTGDYKKAFLSHQQFKTLNDSLFNKENIQKITQLEYDYKYKQRLDSASIRELKLTRTVKSTSKDLAKSQRYSFIAIIIILIISIISGGIIFYLKWRHVNATNQNIIIEQKLLRSQMTPHFIFNSLSVLQGMILNKEEKKSILYLSKFSKLLRTILENSRHKTVSLSDELSAIDSYMALQNLDVNPSFKYQLKIDKGIDESALKIPPMLIQPFIENAIEHAFVGKKENKEINVKLTIKEKKLICTIADNGIGITTVNQNLRKDKKSLATTITSERLKMLAKDFKEQGAIIVQNRELFNEQGTLVTLVIPYKTQSI